VGKVSEIRTTARSTPTFLLAGVLGLLAVALLAMYFYDRSQRLQIAPGVRIGDVSVGGLSATQT